MTRVQDLLEKVRSYHSGADAGLDPARLQLLRDRAPRPAAAVRGSVLRPSGRRRQHHRRPQARRRQHRHRASARHGGGHPDLARSAAGGVRRRDRHAGRRRHQDQPDQLHQPRGEAGREFPQDDPGDGARHPGDPGQAGRSHRQHAHARPPRPRAPARHRPGDDRHLRPARPPAGHVLDQERARGQRPALPASRGLLPAQAQRGEEEGRARALHPRLHRRPGQEARGGGHRRNRAGSPQALLLDLRQDAAGEPALRSDLRPGRVPHHRRHGDRLLCGARRRPCQLEAGSRALQGLHRAAEDQHVPVAAHDRDRAVRRAHRGADPHPRDAPRGRVRHRRALEVQGRRGRGEHRRAALRLAATAARVAAERLRPAGVPRVGEGGPVQRRGLRVHPEGRRAQLPRGVVGDRLRLPHPLGGRAALRRSAGQRPPGAAALPPAQRRHRRDRHHRRADAEQGLAEQRQDQPRQGAHPRPGSSSSSAAAASRSDARSWSATSPGIASTSSACARKAGCRRSR